jgi:carboxymethylenebutenolidase
MTPDRVERDAAAYVDFLASRESVSAGKLGVVGYCFTGAFAMRTAAVGPDKIAAAASFHEGGLYTDATASPHHVLPRIKARLYFGHAVNDQSMPAEAIEKLGRALASWGDEYHCETYDGAYHGWATPGVPVYKEKQAARAFDQLTGLFTQTLK